MSPAIPARYGHTNLVARDWRRLAAFYQEVLGCVPVPPERDLSGEWLEHGTGVPGARVRGVHLRLPGYGDQGPTLEIFQYDLPLESEIPAVNRVGFGHIAFIVPDVSAARVLALAAGATPVGTIVTYAPPGQPPTTWAYVRDPEGNVVELQKHGV